jgi:hypothetical protein
LIDQNNPLIFIQGIESIRDKNPANPSIIIFPIDGYPIHPTKLN